MPKMDIPLLKFDLEQNPAFFLAKFNKIADINKWNEEQRCLQFCLAIPKEGESWFMSLKEDTRDNYELLKDAFMLRFEEQESKLSLYDKFVSGRQDKQNIVTYVEKVQAIGQRLGRSDKEVFDQIVHGLDDDVKKLVFLKDVTNVAELVKLAKMAEGSKASVNQTTAFIEYNSRGTGRQAKPMFRQAYDTPGRRQPHGGRRQAGRCEHCGMYNHLSIDCKHKGARCFKCNRIGHIARTHNVRQ